jgi:hypothetical protein
LTSERKTTDEVIKAQEILDNEFHAVGAEVGWFYPEADFAGEVAATGRRLAERGRNSGLSILSSFDHPRNYLAHAWLRKNGPADERVSTLDLVSHDKFLLLTQSPGFWEQFESDVVHVEIISSDCEKLGHADTDSTWAKLSGVRNDGAVSVRPDNIVAWRSQT